MFDDVDLDEGEGEWTDYDEKVSHSIFAIQSICRETSWLTVLKAGLPVGVSGVEGEWSRS